MALIVPKPGDPGREVCLHHEVMDLNGMNLGLGERTSVSDLNPHAVTFVRAAGQDVAAPTGTSVPSVHLLT